MSRFRPRRPSAALVVSTVALIAALGGTSYAAFSLPKNSVGTKQLRNNAVTTPKIKNGAVTASKINSAGLTVPNAVHATNATNAINATNAANAGNATNATHATSASTASALGGMSYVVSGSITNFANSQDFGSVTCPSGLFVSGGGAFGSDGLTQSVNSSFPFKTTGSPAPNGWGVWMNNNSASAASFNAYAICVPASSPASFARHALTKH
jgi:hypothetical protein